MANDFPSRSMLRAAVIGIILFSVATPSWGADESIMVGVSTGYPPYYFVQNGELVGVCIELANRAAESINWQISYRQYPWKRLLLYAEKGKVDAIMPLFRTKAREAYLYFDDLDIVDEENRFFTWKYTKINFQGALENIQPFKIGVVEGYSYGERFDTFPNLTIVPTKNDHHLVKMFKHKRFDVGIGSKDVVMFNARDENIADQIYFLEPAVTKTALYIGFSKAKVDENRAQRFSAALQQIKSSEAYRSILGNYGLVLD